MVPQDGYLVDTTVAENIRYGRPAATDDEIELARAPAVDRRGGREVIVFDAGRVVERAHAELVGAGGTYARPHASWTRNTRR